MKLFTTPYEVDFSARDAAPNVDPLFSQRWSPRTFKKIELPEEILQAVFDAARWSPSSYNEQPWQFITNKDNSDFPRFLELLVEENQHWAKNASVLGFIVMRKHSSHNGKPNNIAKFDCGSAWMAMTLQARKFGLYTHGMGGIKRDEIYPAIGIDKNTHEVICGFALGVIDTPSAAEAGREKPSQRHALSEIWHRGRLRCSKD